MSTNITSETSIMASNAEPDLTLYSSTISNASACLRIALALKKLPYKLIAINLSKGEQYDPAFKAVNPLGTVPLLIHKREDGKVIKIGQSIAALEYLDEAFPDSRPLLPHDAARRAHIRTLVAILASDTHPLLTHRVGRAIPKLLPGAALRQSDDEPWDKHWLFEGLSKFEAVLSSADGNASPGEFCVRNEATMADVVLLPEAWMARRIGVDFSELEDVSRAFASMEGIEEVRREEQRAEDD